MTIGAGEDKMRGFGIRPDDMTAETIEIGGGLQDMYEWIGCDCIDIARRYVEDVLFDFVIDDEGLLKEGNKLACVGPDDSREEGYLVGNVVVLGERMGPDGPEWRSLTDGEVAVLERHRDVGVVSNPDGTTSPALVLGDVSYGPRAAQDELTPVRNALRDYVNYAAEALDNLNAMASGLADVVLDDIEAELFSIEEDTKDIRATVQAYMDEQDREDRNNKEE